MSIGALQREPRARSAPRHAQLQRTLGDDPARQQPPVVIKPYPERKRERCLSVDELKSLTDPFDTAEAEGSIARYEAGVIWLLIFTGSWLSEITTLEWDRVDVANAWTILECHNADHHGAKILPLNARTLKVLTDLPCVDDNPYAVIGQKSGKHLINLQKPWRRVRKAIGLDDVCIHDLRHSFASFAIGAGGSLALTAEKPPEAPGLRLSVAS